MNRFLHIAYNRQHARDLTAAITGNSSQVAFFYTEAQLRGLNGRTFEFGHPLFISKALIDNHPELEGYLILNNFVISRAYE